MPDEADQYVARQARVGLLELESALRQAPGSKLQLRSLEAASHAFDAILGRDPKRRVV